MKLYFVDKQGEEWFIGECTGEDAAFVKAKHYCRENCVRFDFWRTKKLKNRVEIYIADSKEHFTLKED